MPRIPRPHVERTSDLLQRLLDTPAEQEATISIREFIDTLGERAIALAIFCFSLPNSLPIPGIPGFSTLTGLPIVFLALQIVLGRPTLWLPKRLAEKRFSRPFMQKVVRASIPYVFKVEKVLKPRWIWVCEGRGERVIGALLMVLALVLAFPIPLGNFLPGIAITLIALAMIEKDGLVVAVVAAYGVAVIKFFELIIAGVVGKLYAWIVAA